MHIFTKLDHFILLQLEERNKDSWFQHIHQFYFLFRSHLWHLQQASSWILRGSACPGHDWRCQHSLEGGSWAPEEARHVNQQQLALVDKIDISLTNDSLGLVVLDFIAQIVKKKFGRFLFKSLFTLKWFQFCIRLCQIEMDFIPIFNNVLFAFSFPILLVVLVLCAAKAKQ